MTPTNGSRTLADALNAGQSQPARDGGNPLIDRLATALAVKHAEDDFDDADEDLDLPMLVQGERYGAIVTTAPVQRMREGRAALVGFGLGLVLLVPIGVVMSGRVTEVHPPHAEALPSVEAQFLPTVARLETARAPTPTLNPTASFTANVEEIVPAPKKETIAESFSPAPPPAVAVQAAPPPVPLESKLAHARDLIAGGDVESARTSLKALGADHEPAVMMMLAETYDPNMLAAWSSRGAVSDVNTARTLYQRALALGNGQARQRLQALE